MAEMRGNGCRRGRRRAWLLAGALALAPVVAPAVPVKAAEPERIGVSYQPALYWALPFYIATQKGWWKEVGLEPTFAVFPAGAPQVAAAQAGSWDVGGTGSVPAILGAARFGLLTIGLTNDESKTNALMVRAARHDAILKNPKQLAGQKLLVTTNSTADYAARACLRKWGLGPREMRFVNLGQAQIISAMIADAGEVVGVWAPNTYTLEEKAGAQVLCSGADADAMVPGALITRADFAKAHPDAVAKFLAVYLRGWGWAKANPKDAHDMAKRFYAEGGVEASDHAIDQEFALRPTYALESQLKALARADGPSQVDGWFSRIGTFMAEVGTIAQAPDAKGYIDDAFMKRVAADPKLRAFATEFDAAAAPR
ncbi:NitT/TauT family transport system substrate-binding protein [Methylobacterium sp. 275MFSha3.1]|uniref:ABC transporter substrate-binding protein n=1 Tax=Methylobacterium sp. 275MFSha3.1 TaxID=1502746 RepID=UPI0008A8088E|nr:ABC transporter substrate-binding protein [Methylobacterium sp. 275MFSha3.1]SEI15296.1 NitT/TauT family transport system substrate-binding protein [Methylobacterium sp. 275MFSha3.1]